MTIPSDHYMSPPEPNLVKEVRTQYIIEDGIVAVKTTTRKYYGDADYQDDFGVEIIGSLQDPLLKNASD